MSKAPKSAISKLRFTLDKSSEFSRATKTMLTLIGPSLEMYKGPGIQILGTISAFINQRLVEIVKPTDYADWRVTRFQRFVDNQDAKIGWNISQPVEEWGVGFSGLGFPRLFSVSLAVP